MVCNSCGEKPKNTAKDFTKAVVEINNPDKLVLFRKVVVPVSMGTEEDFPASVGKYYNVLLQYEANGDMYLYSSDGIPTKLSSDVSELQHELDQLGIKVDGEILARIAGDDALSNAIADEKFARENADIALGNSITALDDSLATVAKTGNYNDLTNKPTIGNATLTIKRNNTNVGTFTANATSNKSIDISVPTKTSDITNDGSDGSSTYVESDELSAVATSGSYNDLLNKPTIGNATLTIKKNNTNVGTFTANATSNKSIDITVPTKTSELTNNGSDNTSTYVEADELATVATTGNYNDLANKPTIGNGTLTVKRNGTQLGTFKANATSGTTVDISVPTKTSDLTNDGADGTSTFVEADDLPVVDTTYSASSNNAIANSTVTNSLNRDVMTNLTLDTSPSTTTVNLNNTKTNLASPSSTTTTAITLPVASSTQAGVMNSSTFDAVTNNTNNINALLSGAVAVTGLPASPTQAQITSAWQTETGLSTLINRASVYDVTNNKVWTYYTNDTTWHAASNTSQVTVNTFTNSSEGVIKGSTNSGQVFAENDGTGSVNGWDTLTGTVANHTSKLATIEQGAEVNVQSNWTQTNTTADDYIKNKPANLVQDANYVHTDNNFTTTLKNKLNGIESGAEVNQNAFSNVSVNGVTVAADVKTDTLTLAAGNNVTLTGDASNDTVTISSTDTNTTYSFANGTNGFTVTPSGGSAQTITVTPSIADATTSTSGLMSAADKTEFDLSNRVQRRLISDGTLIPDNSDLNTIPFLSVGRYAIQGSAHVSTLINSPTTKPFTMEVFNSVNSVLDNESTGKWIHRVRRITTYDGDEYKQYVYSGNTAGVFTYGNWLRIATTSNIPTVNNATLTIQKNGTNVQTFTANSSENKTANITVPTAVSELTNDANYATTTQLNNGLATKQNTLTAGNAIDITNNVISADVHPADFFTNTTETITAEGTDITMQGTALAPFVGVRPKGDTFQQSYSGKNLYLHPNAGVSHGVTLAVNADGSIDVSGTNDGLNKSDFIMYYPATIVGSDGDTVNFTTSTNTPLPTGVSVHLVVYAQASSGYIQDLGGLNGNGSRTESTTPRTISSSSSWGSFAAIVRVASGTSNVSISGLKIQVEVGTSATTYEPYVGGTASPNPDYPQEVKVVTGGQDVFVHNKNLFKIPDTEDTRNGIKYTPHADGTFDLLGTATANAEFFAVVPLAQSGIVGGERYQASTNSPIGSSSVRYYVHSCTENGGWAKTLMNISRVTTYNTAEEPSTDYIKFVIQIPNGNTINLKNIQFQLEKGTTASSFQPYQSQNYEINLGKNLFDSSQTPITTNGATAEVISTGLRIKATSTGGNTFCAYKLFKSSEILGRTITLSATATPSSQNNQNAYIGLCDENGGNRVSKVNFSSGAGEKSASYTHTTEDASRPYIVIALYSNANSAPVQVGDYVDYTNLQLELGDTATSYAPYITPIELCKIGNYQDYFYKDGDDWYLHKATGKSELGSLTWGHGGTNQTGIYRKYTEGLNTTILPSANNAVFNGLCTHFGAVRSDSSGTYGTNTGISVGSTGTTFIYYSAYNTNADDTAFKTWLTNNNVVLYYALATPTDTKITNTALIEQLNALSNANSYRDLTYITTASDGYNLPIILTAEAFTNSLAGISKAIDGKQNKLTAGENITIDANNVISATATGNSTITMTDTDPGEGQPLAADNYVAVYGSSNEGGFSRYAVQQSIPADTGTLLLADSTNTTDVGVSYNSGVIIIQKAGWWVFTASVGGNLPTTSGLSVDIRVNDVNVASAAGAATASYVTTRTVSWVGKMQVGDTVKVRITSGSAFTVNTGTSKHRGTFTGALIYAS